MYAPAIVFAQTKTQASYAVMSLIGDSLSLVNYGGAGATKGVKVEQNVHQDIPIKETTFDATALDAVAQAIRKAQPDAAQELLQTRNVTLFRMQDRIFDTSDAAINVQTSLRVMLRDHNATQLILLTKHRDIVAMPLESGAYGGGTLDGIGFYVDNSVKLKDPVSGKVGFGYIGAYMFITFRLVDARTLKTIREIPVANYKPLPRTGTGEVTWEKLTDVEKVKFVQGLIRETVEDTIPKLLSGAP
ncbi:MAG: hypothetical protein WDN04_21920 [Rhodospirillales bacterium]